jgi:hypothetical protein
MAKIGANKRALLWCALPLCASVIPAEAQDRVGVTSAINPATTGQPPEGTQRVLLLGQDVVRNETVRTSAEGQAQILFLDKSSFSVGPDSEVVIDEFVYNPTTGVGRLAATAAKGVFRYVGGALSKTEGAVTLKTPAATIGIRGGIVLVDIAAGSTSMVLLFGNAMTIDAPGGSQTIRRGGYGVTVGQNGVPGAPFRANNLQLQGYVRQLDGKPGAGGGAPAPPTNAGVVASGMTQLNAGNPIQANQDAIGHQVVTTPPVVVALLSNQNIIQSATPAANPTPQDVTPSPSPVPVSTTASTPGSTPSPSPAPDPFANLPMPPSEPFPALRSALLADSGIFAFIPDGALTSIANMPTTGSVTYLANQITAFNLGGVTSVVPNACFAQTWDFGSQLGTVSFTTPSIGGQLFSYTGTVQSFAVANSFSGSLAPAGNFVGSAQVNGNFYNDANGRPAGQSAGTFSGSVTQPISTTFTGNFKSSSRNP